jgi:hypothetical protein
MVFSLTNPTVPPKRGSVIPLWGYRVGEFLERERGGLADPPQAQAHSRQSASGDLLTRA